MELSTTSNQTISFRVLGSIEARIDGLAVDVGGSRQRRLLALLLSRHGSVVETSALVEYVWDDDDRPDNATEAVRTYISRLRRSFSGTDVDATSLLVTQAPGYRLGTEGCTVDSAEFERLILEARSHRDDGHAVASLVALDSAIAMWRGSAYQEFGDRPWLVGEIARLAELKRVAVEQRAAVRLELGAHAEVVGELEQLVAEEALRARPVELLMLALHRSGRQAEALRVGTRYRRSVADVGLEPPESMTDLERRIAASDAELQPAAASTDTIRGYQLAEQIGEGSFSVVYRSVQPSLGREVAVKQIRSELADQPDFIRRFESEAQLVAGLEHPHIVPLYDYWREPGSAYLVMRWLRGGTLEARLQRQRLDGGESVTLATQIGSALATAHHAGVEHRDVRTSNVFVDDIGNNYLGDFGIAAEATSNGNSRGAADVRGLAAVLLEAISGKSPQAFGTGSRSLAALRPDLPAPVEGILLRAMVGAGSERYGTVDEFVDDYVEAINQGGPHRARVSPTIPLADDVTNPYKGLRAFQESDADDFRGRGRLVDRLLHQLAQSGSAGRIVAAVGPSGSGKSSIVRAGLLPRVRAGAIARSDAWFVTTMVPGARPFDELEGALNRIAAAPSAGLVDAMNSGPYGITRAVNAVLPDETSELLLVIDQFEEIFTLTESEESRRAFLDGLISAVGDPRSRLRVVMTIRADHWHRPLELPELATLLETSAVTITPMAADELERAITDPARRMGVTFEAGLVSDIVADVHDQPGALPLMQYLLTQLFDERQAGLMELDAYHRLGGVAGGLARRADELYEQCSQRERAGVRRLFSRLITPGEGTEDTRRRVVLSELTMVPDAIIERYAAAQMFSFDHDPGTREPTVEVAHETLIREWPRLRAWIDEDSDGVRTMRHVANASAEWLASGRPDAELYRGARLETAEAWSTTHADEVSDVERDFLLAAAERRDRDAAAERRRLRRLRSLLTITGVIAVIALVAGTFAWSAQRRADDHARDAESQRRAAEDLALLESDARAEAERSRDDAERSRDEAEVAAGLEQAARADGLIQQRIAESASVSEESPSLSMLLALEAHERSPSSETLGAVLTSLQHVDGYLGHVSVGPAWQNDQWLGLLDDETAVVRTPSTIDLYDLVDHRRLSTTSSEARSSNPFAQGAVGGGRFATVSASGELLTIEPGATTPSAVDMGTSRVPSAVGVAVDTTLIVGYEGGGVELVSGSDAVVSLVGHTSDITSAALNSDATRATTMDAIGNITMWDVEEKSAMWTFTRFERDRWLDPAGVRRGNLTWGRVDGGPPVFDDVSSVDDRPLSDLFSGLRFSSDDSSIFMINEVVSSVATESGEWRGDLPSPGLMTQVSEMASGRLLIGREFYENAIKVDQLDRAGPEARVAVTSDDSTAVVLDDRGLSLWALDGRQLLARAHDRAMADIATLGSNGDFIATFSGTGSARDARLHDRHQTEVGRAADASDWWLFNSGGHLIEYSPWEASARLLDPSTASPVTRDFDVGEFASIEVSNAGRLIAIGETENGTAEQIRILDASTGEPVTTLLLSSPGRIGVHHAEFSPGDDYFAASNGESVTIFETGDWTIVDTVDASAGGLLKNVAFSPDGSDLAIITDDERIVVYDVETGRTRQLATSTVVAGSRYSTNALEYTEDGRYIVVSGGGFNIVDASTGAAVGRHFPDGDVGLASTIADGARAAVTPAEGHFLVWNLDPVTWPNVACHAAGRNMTPEEWAQFGWPDEERSLTCDGWP